MPPEGSVTVELENEEHEEEKTLERAVGRLEALVEGHSGLLEEHKTKIEGFEAQHEWIRNELAEIRRIYNELPIAPTAETMDAIFNRLAELETKIVKEPQKLAESLTEPPEREVERQVEQTENQAQGVLHHLASIL